MKDCKQYQWKVSVRCYTYNQASFIKDAMDGFCNQITTFPFVCNIVDDASTDGEPYIIKNYLLEYFDLCECSTEMKKETDDYYMYFARHKSNIYCYFAVFFLKYNHHRKKAKRPYLKFFIDNSKYEALCEGDDCWVHPEKLQMQVDFLDLNTDYSLVHTDFDLINGKRIHYKEICKDGKYFPDILYRGVHIGTLTVLYRLSTYNTLSHLYRRKGWPMGDFPLWIEFSQAAKIKYLDIVTANYRFLQTSASHSQDITQLIRFKEKAIEIKRFYANYYNIELPNNGRNKYYYIDIMRFAYRLNDNMVANQYFHRAMADNQLSLKLIIYYVGIKFHFFRKIIGSH